MDEDKRAKRKHIIEAVSAIAAVVGFYGVLNILGISCPIKYLTGISCAGCGMTRAWIAFLHFDFAGAFYYHPLFLLPPVAAIVIMFKSKININIYKVIMFTMIAAFVIVYVYRFVSEGNDVVVFRPEDGLVFRLIKSII